MVKRLLVRKIDIGNGLMLGRVKCQCDAVFVPGTPVFVPYVSLDD